MFVIVAVLATVAAGCSKSSSGATAPPSSSGTPTGASGSPSSSSSPNTSPSPGTSADAVIEFSVDGAGPYQLGMTLTALRTSLDRITAGADPCPDNTTAFGTGVWKDIQLSFKKDGSLYMMTNRSLSVPTPSGAYLGTPLGQLKTIYKNIGGQDLNAGANSAYLVTTIGGRGILFELDLSKSVKSMRAGDSAYLRTAFTGDGKFC